VTGAATFWVFVVAHRYALHGAALVAGLASVGGAATLVLAIRRRLHDGIVIVAATLASSRSAWCSSRCRISNATSRSARLPTSSGRA